MYVIRTYASRRKSMSFSLHWLLRRMTPGAPRSCSRPSVPFPTRTYTRHCTAFPNILRFPIAIATAGFLGHSTVATIHDSTSCSQSRRLSTVISSRSVLRFMKKSICVFGTRPRSETASLVWPFYHLSRKHSALGTCSPTVRAPERGTDGYANVIPFVHSCETPSPSSLQNFCLVRHLHT